MSRLHLQRLRVAQLRQFRGSYELAELSPGLNLFTGPNEAGKSTLVRAIRAAFFERHRSTAVDDLRPWGDSAACPSIELDFQLGGTAYSLQKSFLGRKRCDLLAGSRSYEGAEAEDHLAQLFGFGFAAKGASREEHWGVPGLLWVQQGAGQELQVAHAREHLHQALARQVGGAAPALAASGGDALLATLQAQRAELLTATGKPRADLQEALQRTDELNAQLASLDAQIAHYRNQVDELARLQAQHRHDEAEQPWLALAAQLSQARAQQQAIEALRQQLADDEAALAQLEATRQLLLDQLGAFAAQGSAAAARAQVRERMQAQLQHAAAALDAARAQLEQARQRDVQARAALAQADRAAQRRQAAEQLQQAQQQHTQAQQALARAEQAQQQLAQAQAQAPQQRITPADVDALAQRELTLREAALRKDQVATRVVFKLAAGQQVQLLTGEAQRSVHGQQELHLAQPTRVLLPGGLGELTILPGGDELEPLRQAHHSAQQALQAALARLGVASVEEARGLAQACAEHQQQLALARKALELAAPEGLAALQAASQGAQQRAQQLAAQLQALAAAEAPASSQPAERGGPAAFAQATEPGPDGAGNARSLADCTLEAAAAHTALQRAQASWQDAQLAHTRGLTQLEQAEQEWQAAQQLLSGPERASRLAAAQQALAAHGAEQAACRQRMAHTAEQLARANPGYVAQDIERLQRSVQQLQARHQQRREAMLLLQNTLEVSGAQGLDEQRAALAGELERAQRRRTQLQRRAQALDHLCTQLQAKRQRSLQLLQQPLLDRLQHYLPLLFPGASLEVADDLSPAALLRSQGAGTGSGSPTVREAGAIDALSFGAREQIGLICRFAYADLLAQAGRPTLLILDDALVHSDEARHTQMKRVLYDVAQRHQVLVFTCHPNAWRDMGVAMREIGVDAA